MLKIRNLTVRHNQITAVNSVSLHINKNEMVTLIGSNGAGKTSLLEAIAGLNSNKDGEVIYQNENISKYNSNRIVSEGISLVPEGRQIFGSMSVMDNLLLGGYSRLKKEKRESLNFDFVLDMFPVLKERIKQPAGSLSGGEQQMLAIARAIMSKPKVLLLDEPSTGLAPIIIKQIFQTLKKLKEESGLSVLLVEQNAKLSLEFSDRGYALETGVIISEGKSSDLLRDKNIVRAYLGRDYKEVTD